MAPARPLAVPVPAALLGMVCLITGACFATGSGPKPSFSPFTDGLPTGLFHVGVEIVRWTDASRPFGDPAGSGRRPLQATIWYPAEQRGTPLRYGDMVEWIGVEGSSADLNVDLAAAGRDVFVDYFASLGAPKEALELVLQAPLNVTLGARPVRDRRFPLVLLAVGIEDSPVLHAILAEYLAADGMIVAALPAMGATSRSMPWAAESLESHVIDLEMLLARVAADPRVDSSAVAVVGFSFGAGTALLLGMRGTPLRAVVSLDGSIGFANRIAYFTEFPGWAPGAFDPPVLHLNTASDARNDASLLASLSGPVTVGTFAKASHYDFSTVGAFPAAAPDFALIGTDGLLGDDPVRVHHATLLWTRAFLRHHLVGESGAWRGIVESCSTPDSGSCPAGLSPLPGH